MKLTFAAILIAILANAPAFANDPNWNGDPEPEPKPPTVVVENDTVDGDSAYDPYGRIYYSICTCNEVRVAWGFESLEYRTNKALDQCEVRTERMSCPKHDNN